MEIIGENVKIKKIAITGIIASGKSTLCDFLAKDESAYVVKSDELVHQLYSQNKEIQQYVINEFGNQSSSSEGLNRKKLADIVFNDPAALKKLETIIHPQIISTIKELYEKVKDKSYTAFVVEFPLLFEIGFNKWFDKNVVVVANEDDCKKRFDHIRGRGSFDKRMANQLFQSEKQARADLIIKNTGSIEHLKSEAHKCVA